MRKLILLLALVGCSQSPAVLRCDSVSVSEDKLPPIVTLKIANTGGSAASIDRAAVTNFKRWIIGPPPAKGDSSREMQWRLVLLDAAPVTIAPDATVALSFKLEWVTDPSPPPMLAIVETEFITGPALVRTRPLSFVLQSQQGLLEAESNKPPEPEQDAIILEELKKFGGQRSPGFSRLLDSLKPRQETP